MGASTRKIQGRINATKKTSQITKAMNMVSASSLRGAEAKIRSYYPFNIRLEELVTNLASSDLEEKNVLLETRPVKRVCYLVITSERGLAGPFNSNIYKLLTSEIENVKSQGIDAIVAPLGSKGAMYVHKMKYPMIEENIVQLRDDVAFSDVSSTINKIIREYIKGTIDEVRVLYNHYVNTLTITPTIKKLLPIEIKKNEENLNSIYDYVGGADEILYAVLPLYIESLVYGIILDSKASAPASRMTAMKSATDNATELIEKLELQYNRARQSAITSDLIDIIGGANALGK